MSQHGRRDFIVKSFPSPSSPSTHFSQITVSLCFCSSLSSLSRSLASREYGITWLLSPNVAIHLRFSERLCQLCPRTPAITGLRWPAYDVQSTVPAFDAQRSRADIPRDVLGHSTPGTCICTADAKAASCNPASHGLCALLIRSGMHDLRSTW